MTIDDRWRTEPRRVGIPAGYPQGDVQLRREHSSPWPCVVLVCVLVLCATAFAIKDLTYRPVPPEIVSAAAQVEVTRVVTETPSSTPQLTQTARVVLVTPTGTATPVIPWCDQVKAGSLCVQLPIPRTATAITECDAHPTYQRICVKSASDTESEGATK